jgi:hypothetical protein
LFSAFFAFLLGALYVYFAWGFFGDSVIKILSRSFDLKDIPDILGGIGALLTPLLLMWLTSENRLSRRIEFHEIQRGNKAENTENLTLYFTVLSANFGFWPFLRFDTTISGDRAPYKTATCGDQCKLAEAKILPVSQYR